jgi:hypothetical protein
VIFHDGFRREAESSELMTQAGAPAEAVQRLDIPVCCRSCRAGPWGARPILSAATIHLVSLGLVPEKPSHEHGECWRAVGKPSP